MARAAVLMPNWIGDFVMALSVALRAPWAAKDEGATLLVPEGLTDLAGMLCDIAAVPVDRTSARGWVRGIGRVRHAAFDRAYILPHSFSSALFAWAAGVPHRRGVARDGRRVLLNDALPRSLRDHSAHLTREYAAVLETEWSAPEEWRGIPVPPDATRGGRVVLCPGAQYGPAKQWPWFAELASFLPDERIVVLGGPGDRAAGENIRSRAVARVENLAGHTSLCDAAGILAAARCVVSNDSGLMHLAGILGTPVVGIFGSTSPGWTRPLGPRSVVVCREEPCSPCMDRQCRFGHYDCLRRITPEQVAEAITTACAAAPQTGGP